MVQVSIHRLAELERSEADVVEGFIVEDHALVSHLSQIEHSKRRVVGLDDCVGDFE